MLLSADGQKEASFCPRAIGELLYGARLLMLCTSQSCEIGMQYRHAVHSWRLILSGPDAVLARAPCLFRCLPPLFVFSFARILHSFLPTGVTSAVKATKRSARWLGSSIAAPGPQGD